MLYHNALIDSNIHALNQGIALIEQIDDEMYTLAAHPLFNSGVGSHFRHCLDAYDCLFRGIDTGKINYDHRERDEMVERDREYAAARIKLTIDRLRSLSSGDELISLIVKQDSAAWTYASIGRELQFLLSHTIHHYALIALILRLQGFSPAEQFGVAPSTLEYWKEGAVCAR